MTRFECQYRTLDQLSKNKGKIDTPLSPTINHASTLAEKPSTSSSRPTPRPEFSFTGGPLKHQLKDRFSTIFSYLLSYRFSRTAAEQIINVIQGKAIDKIDSTSPAFPFGYQRELQTAIPPCSRQHSRKCWHDRDNIPSACHHSIRVSTFCSTYPVLPGLSL